MAVPEILLRNATIRTMASPGMAEALLIRGDRLAWVGSERECYAEATGDPQVLDLGGATVLPGFVDAHCHPLMYGQFASWVDCSWESTPDIESVVSALRARADRRPSGPVHGRGFHHGNVAEQRMLTRQDLDRVAQDRQVLVFHSSGHGAMVNSWALRAAGVDEQTPDPAGGHFGRDADGKLTGEVWDSAADWLTGTLGVKITNNGPNFHIPDEPEALVEQLAAAQRDMHAVGVTTVVDAQVTSRELQTYLRLRRQAELTLRVEMMMISSLLPEVEALGLGARLGDDQLAFTGIKLYVDGALTAGTARFEEPYCCRGDGVGYLYHEPAELADLVQRAAGLGLQTATHAQGDAAIEIVLDAHTKVRAAGNNAVRHRIEHFGAPTAAQIKRAAELELWPVTQPQYVRRYGDELSRALGERAQRISPLGELREAGLPLVLSSDAPVCPPDPLEAIYSAATRRTLSGKMLGSADQCLTVEQALTAHTIGAAASVHREAEVGSLESGKLADLIVLSADPVTVPPAELLDITVRQTWVGGAVVFELSAIDRPKEGTKIMNAIVGPVDGQQSPRYAGLTTFARLPRVEDVADYDVAVVGIPFDAGVTFRPGARFGPSAIREASRLLRPYNPALESRPFADAQVVDAGDIACNPFDIPQAMDEIQLGLERLMSGGRPVVSLGGDHTIALPALRAAAAQHGPLALVHFDAHLDTWDTYFGAPYTHGTPFRRASEEGLIRKDRSVHAGIRGSLYDQKDLLDDESLGFTIINCRDFDRIGTEGILERVLTRVGDAPLYISIDIDVLDPAFAPATGTPESGGMTSRELLGVIRGLRNSPIVAADIVEVSPAYDHAAITAVAAANLAYEFVSIMSDQKERSKAE